MENKVYYRELCKVLSADYISLAFDLPPGSGTIWSIMQGDMDTLGSIFPRDEDGILQFLQIFFSSGVIDVVRRNLAALVESHHGIEYTLGRTKATIGKSIMDGIREEAAETKGPLTHFLGQVSEVNREADKEWQVVCTRQSKGGDTGGRSGSNRVGGEVSNSGASGARGAAQSSQEGGLGGAAGVGGSGSAGGSSGSGGLQLDGDYFSTMKNNIVEIHLAAFKTPERGDFERNLTIKDRAKKFHEAVPEPLRNHKFLYDPHSQQSQRVSLYHGTRTSSLSSFCLAGIRPPRTEGGEFSQLPAFYVNNSMRHAFERPLHYKLGRDARDFVSVMEFRIDPHVLHGQKNPLGESTPFTYCWFSRPSSEWKQFCIGNMSGDPKVQATVPLHSYDVVIGPICKPVDGGTDMHVYGDRISGQVYLTQIAFCTPRSWRYLESCFMRVYQEKRDACS